MNEKGERRKLGGQAKPGRNIVLFRSAVTLFELLLVLVLLVVIGSLAAPLLESSFSSVRLRRSTDQVLASWSQARTHAIETGFIYQFKFQPNGSDYRVDRWNGGVETDATQELSQLERTSTETDRSNDEKELLEWTYEATLPEGIKFNEARSVSVVGSTQRAVTRLDQQSKDDWSAPILFFPDGTTSEASIVLKSGENLHQVATLRALTGVARVSEVLTSDEVDRYHLDS